MIVSPVKFYEKIIPLEFPIFLRKEFFFRISKWNQEKENGWAGDFHSQLHEIINLKIFVIKLVSFSSNQKRSSGAENTVLPE